jgi:hypothetical protein
MARLFMLQEKAELVAVETEEMFILPLLLMVVAE